MSNLFDVRFWATTAKSILSLNPIRPKNGRITLAFEKELDGGWFAVIPAWPGPKSALAMVAGADTFLDSLLPHPAASLLTLDLSATQTSPEELTEAWELLTYIEPEEFGDGAYYRHETTDHRMWLCGVTAFVFGEMPERIWFRVIQG